MDLSRMRYNISNAICIPIFLLSFWSLSLSVASSLSQKESPRINNQSELETILKEERKKLLIKDNYAIHVNLTDKNIGNAGKIKENKYKINLGGKFRNISCLRHELYHIADGHCDDCLSRNIPYRIIKYLCYYEPQAILYQVAGIKL